MFNRLHTVVMCSAAAAMLLAGCTHPTRAQKAIDQGWITFGTPVETTRGVNPEVTPENLKEHADTAELVVLSGTVSDVCRTMGCWLEIAGPSGLKVRVMNKDHAFFVPRNARGRKVYAIGQATYTEHSVDMLKHLAADAGKPQAEIDAITQPEKSLVFVAQAVILPGSGLEAPVQPAPAAATAPAAASTEGASK